MAAGKQQHSRPWCPFCGVEVGRPSETVQRTMKEFPAGRCQCGAVYVSDATGHSIGAAMVECLVFACGDEWDMAWELIPEDDYLTGIVEDYDDVTHQICPKRNLDGRAVRGILYFVRLHKDIAEVAARFAKKKELEAQTAAGAAAPPVEPARDPKRQKRTAAKPLVKQLAEAGDVNALVDLSFDDKRTLRFLQKLLYEPLPEKRYHVAWLIGQVAARLSTREPAPVADMLHRLFEACSDSASMPWGMVEAIGAIIAARTDIYGAFTRHLLNFMSDEGTREAALHGLGEIAAVRPDLVRRTPFYSLFPLLGHESAAVRGLTVRLLGRVKANEVIFQIMALQQDMSEVVIYQRGEAVKTTVAALVTEAVAEMRKPQCQQA
ncbi:DVU0298 family protein [Candidatus Electronema sp. JM]|uniref:DVU0298 family protein n=1 Tax=Candidatus Electronema sp. JM TaxID=3401571 RepID=UPI003AA92751